MNDYLSICDEIKRQLLLSPKVRSMRGITAGGLHVLVEAQFVSQSVFGINRDTKPEEYPQRGYVKFTVSVAGDDGTLLVDHVFTDLEIKSRNVGDSFIADWIVRKFNGQHEFTVPIP